MPLRVRQPWRQCPAISRVCDRLGPLGSGLARGWAHLGVLQRLKEHGYEPDIVAGTSMGALVGGCYAAGNLNQLQAYAENLTRRRVFGLLDLTLGGSGLISGNVFTLK